MPPFDPAQFLRVAVSLAAQDMDEAALRTAVGRAYYSVFLVVRDKLGVTTTERVHGEVIRVLARRNRKATDQMRYLLNLRIAADYQLTPEGLGNQDWKNNWIRAQGAVAIIQPLLSRL